MVHSNDESPSSEYLQSLDLTRSIGQDLKYVLGAGWRAVERLIGRLPASDSANEVTELRLALGEADRLADTLLHRSATAGEDRPSLDVDALVASMPLTSILGPAISLSLRLSASGAVVAASRDDLAAVVELLVEGAARVMPDGGALTVSTGWMDHVWGASVRGRFWPRRHVRITIGDTGPGDYDDTCRRVLDSPAPAESGSRSVAEIVGWFGGYLILENSHDEGSRVHVCLPAAPDASQPHSA